MPVNLYGRICQHPALRLALPRSPCMHHEPIKPEGGGFDHQPRRGWSSPPRPEACGELARELGGGRGRRDGPRHQGRRPHAERAVTLLREAGLAVAVFDAVRENPTTVDVAGCVWRGRPGSRHGPAGGPRGRQFHGHRARVDISRRTADPCGITGGLARPRARCCRSSPSRPPPALAASASAPRSSPMTRRTRRWPAWTPRPRPASRSSIPNSRFRSPPPSPPTPGRCPDPCGRNRGCRRRNPISQMYSHEAFKRLVPAFPRVLAHPQDLEARGQMLLGAAFAGRPSRMHARCRPRLRQPPHRPLRRRPWRGRRARCCRT